MTYELLNADYLDWLRGRLWLVRNGYMPRYHAVFADPPYALISISKRFGSASAAPAKFGKDGAFSRASRGFMGQTWDGWETLADYQAWVTEWAALTLEFVYPGAFLAMFGGARTAHRLATGLEESGWEIVDVIAWCYGSGFPKSHAVTNDFRKARRGGNFDAISNQAMVNLSLYERRDLRRLELNFDGYGSALKPAYEPVILARAPKNGAPLATLARDFGTGSLNIDAGRVGTGGDRATGGIAASNYFIGVNAREQRPNGGRWPANLLFDEAAAAVLDEQSGDVRAGGNLTGDEPSPPAGYEVYGNYNRVGWQGYNDSGGASRFFYTSKASSAERLYPAGDGWQRLSHPTLKPLDLTRWLTSLLLPPSGVGERRLLTPFAGVGSEMIGAYLSGWDTVTGIEQSADYVQQGTKRLAYWLGQPDYETGLETIKAARRAAKLDDDEPAAAAPEIVPTDEPIQRTLF